MNDKERIEKAFSSIKAPSNTLEKVYYSANNKNNSMKVLLVSIFGTFLAGTIVYATTSYFGITPKFFKSDAINYSDDTKNTISVLEENKENAGLENTYIDGFYISETFCTRVHPITGEERFHDGIDIVADKGTDILAVADGVVEKAEFNSNYGNHVIIKHIDGYETLFAHLQDIDVEVDQKVVTGEKIGTVGNTGMSTGPHLHFELRKDGKAIDPTPYIK